MSDADSKERLDEMSRRFAALSEAAFEGVVIAQEGKMVEVNRAGARMLGFDDPRELAGRSILEFVDEDSGRRILAQIQSADETPYEVVCVRRDGSRFPAQLLGKNIEYLGHPARVAVVRDISERKKAEERLGRWELLFRNAHWGTAAAKDGRFVDVMNSAYASMHGYAISELVGQAMELVVAEEARAGYRVHIESAASAGRSQFESVHVKKDGSRFEVLVELTAIPGEAGEVLYHAMQVQDLTEQKAAENERLALEEQVRRAQKLESLGILAGGIAHDFNNLLVGILGNVDLALKELPSDARERALLENIKRAARRATDLTAQMLAYSGKGRIASEPVDVSETVREMHELLESAVVSKIPIVLSLDDSLPLIEGDPTKLGQVVMNLITNASDAVGPGPGRIHLRTGRQQIGPQSGEPTYLAPQVAEGQYVFVEVEDTGVGMSAETRARMFEPFFTTKFAGRGLGLAATLGIVRGHQGYIEVHSKPGEGTRIRVLFPANANVERLGVKEELPRASEWQGTGVALVVDDEPSVRHVARAILERVGFDVVTAEDGAKAIELFTTAPERFSLVLVDATMPGLSGGEVIRRLRQMRSDVPVILSSGYDELEVALELRGDPRASFIQKPYEVGTLVEMVRATVGSFEG